MKKYIYPIVFSIFLMASCGKSGSNAPGGSAPGNDTMLVWDTHFPPEDYFKYGSEDTPYHNGGASIAVSPFSDTVLLHEKRNDFEQEKIIPVMDGHPLFDLAVLYNDGGSLYLIEISWQRTVESYTDIDPYSQLLVRAAPQKEALAWDADGSTAGPGTTVIERGGVYIETKGHKNTEKQITFQKDGLWYLIKGFTTDSCKTVITLLDWFWEHPLEPARFVMD